MKKIIILGLMISVVNAAQQHTQPPSHLPQQLHGLHAKRNAQTGNLQPSTPGWEARAAKRQQGKNVKSATARVDYELQRIVSFGEKSGLFKAIKGVPLVGPNIDTLTSILSMTGQVIGYIGHKVGNRIKFKNSYQSEHEKLYDQYNILLGKLEGLSTIMKKKAKPVVLSRLGQEHTLAWYEKLNALAHSKIWRDSFSEFMVKHGFERPDREKEKQFKELREQYQETLKEFKIVYRDLIMLSIHDELENYKCALAHDRCQTKLAGLRNKLAQNQAVIDGLNAQDSQVDVRKRDRIKGAFRLKGAKTLIDEKKNAIIADLTGQNNQIVEKNIGLLDLVNRAQQQHQAVQHEHDQLQTVVDEVEMLLGDAPGGDEDLSSRIEELEKAINAIKQHVGMPIDLPQDMGAAPPPPLPSRGSVAHQAPTQQHVGVGHGMGAAPPPPLPSRTIASQPQQQRWVSARPRAAQ